jgi:HSP20 family protein
MPRDDRAENLRGRDALDEMRRRLDDAGLGGVLGGFTDLLGRVVDAAEKNQTHEREGGFRTRDGREGRFRVGFNVRTLAGEGGEQRVAVEPFGDVTRDRSTGHAAVSETREPPVDVFEERDHVLIVVEMPGVDANEASFAIEGDVLRIEADAADKRYRKETLLPSGADPASMTVASRHGVFEIRFDLREDARG